ncbi:MAG: DUF1287 domain-containing protein [Clostridia bacterium]|nr:DUF1287 domain-containing protein [Clostridia bacterium]
MSRKIIGFFFLCVWVCFAGCAEHTRNADPHLSFDNLQKEIKEQSQNDRLIADIEVEPTPYIKIDKIAVNIDRDKDGILDLEDIVEGARLDAVNKPIYKNAYYSGGYPPDSEGVCTDVIWRAFKCAGYNLKDMLDKDINKYTSRYPRVEGKPDPNIDFRRVPNLYVFFKKFGKSLVTSVKPYDVENLKEWQGGDIVVFDNPQHIAIVSDKRRPDGIPYIIHNAGPYTRECDELLLWIDGIIGHFRFPK